MRGNIGVYLYEMKVINGNNHVTMFIWFISFIKNSSTDITNTLTPFGDSFRHAQSGSFIQCFHAF